MHATRFNTYWMFHPQAKDQSSPRSLTKLLRRIDTGLVPRNNTARFVRRLAAAAHNVPIRVDRIVHERIVEWIAVAVRVVIRPEI